MRHLNRVAVPPPTCLSHYNPNAHTWEHLRWEDREEIRDRLGELQNYHCAYCECDITRESRKPHIEHFEQRSRARSRTFDWSNLFWSCSHPERCGKRKDDLVRDYRLSDLLKPDVDYPREYLFFMSDGGVENRDGLDNAGAQRAQETIRVFGLDGGGLISMRRAHLAGPIASLEEVQAAGFTHEEANEFIQELVTFYADQPFSSAVLDVLGVAP